MRCLTAAVLAVLLVLLMSMTVAGQTAPAARMATLDSAEGTGAPKLDEPTTGAQLLERVAASIASRPAIVAKSRFQIELFDQHLVGSGLYHEASYARDRLLRIEYKIPVAGGVTSFQRISDGRYVWTRTELPAINTQSIPLVRRIDLQRLREQAREPFPAGALEYPIGGIGHVLRELLLHYDFAAAMGNSHQGMPAVIVQGTLRDVADSGDGDEVAPPAIEPMSILLPTAVTLVIGQQDLFPFVIQYHGSRLESTMGTSDRAARDRETVMTIEYFAVDFPPRLDPRLFIYHAGETGFEDDTEKYLPRNPFDAAQAMR